MNDLKNDNGSLGNINVDELPDDINIEADVELADDSSIKLDIEFPDDLPPLELDKSSSEETVRFITKTLDEEINKHVESAVRSDIRNIPHKIYKVGNLTLGLSFVFIGIALLAYMHSGLDSFLYVISFTPIILISFGIEVVFFSVFFNSKRVKYSILSLLICSLMVISSIGIAFITPVITDYINFYQQLPEIERDVMSSISNKQNISHIQFNPSIDIGKNILEFTLHTDIHLISSIDTEDKFLNEIISIINDLSLSEFMFREIMISVTLPDSGDTMIISLVPPYYKEWSVDTIRSMIHTY